MGTKNGKNSEKKTEKKTKGKTKKSGNIELGAKFRMELDVDIDEKQMRAKEHRIRQALTERVQELEQARPYRDKAKALAAEVERLRGEVENMTEKKMVQVVEEFDHAHQEVRTRRLDTNKIIPGLTRTMTAEDRQEDIFTKKNGKPKKAEKAPAAHAKDEDAAESIAASEADGMEDEPQVGLTDEPSEFGAEEADEAEAN